MTSNASTTTSYPGLSDDTLYELEKLVATGQLTNNGQDTYKSVS